MRLSNPFMEYFTIKTHEACWRSCKLNPKCYSSMIHPVDGCYLFDTSREIKEEDGFITYSITTLGG
jgi:hypothetical protein